MRKACTLDTYGVDPHQVKVSQLAFTEVFIGRLEIFTKYTGETLTLLVPDCHSLCHSLCLTVH